MATIKLADYLFTRLRQLGIDSIHGVPGDYNLTLLDYVKPAGFTWVGSANELNAGYAADGYARIKGIGALITTFGVGELSAVNAIAGAFTERAAVVHIVGTPARSSHEKGLKIHHTLTDGNYRHFQQMASHVAADQTNLWDEGKATEQIDEILRTCLEQSRPVYIELPVDMVAASVSDASLNQKLTIRPPKSSMDDHEIVSSIVRRMRQAEKPLVLVDFETRSLGMVNAVQSFVEISGWPTFTSASAVGLIRTDLENVHGIYAGKYSSKDTQTLFENSDLILNFGPHLSTTNTYANSAIPKSEITISFMHAGVQLADEDVRSVDSNLIFALTLEALEAIKLPHYEPSLPSPDVESASVTHDSKSALLQQDKAWKLLGNLVQSGDIVMGETGTAAYGVREMSLPANTRLFTAITWLSIGYMLPAAQGAALAQKELASTRKSNKNIGNHLCINGNTYNSNARTILFIGDGSFQMTCQELAAIIRHNLNVTIVIINNNGYTIERCIHGKNEEYNDISQWQYDAAIKLFGGKEDAWLGSARTYGELDKIMSGDRLREPGIRMFEVVMNQDDALEGMLMDLMRKQESEGRVKERNGKV